MEDKLNYHLTNLFSEFKKVLLQEITLSIHQSLSAFEAERFVDSSKILNIDEVSKEFKISKSHINKLRDLHEDFPTIKIGGSIRFKKQELEEFFKRKSLTNKKV